MWLPFTNNSIQKPSSGAGHNGQELVSESEAAEGGVCPHRRAET